LFGDFIPVNAPIVKPVMLPVPLPCMLCCIFEEAGRLQAVDDEGCNAGSVWATIGDLCLATGSNGGKELIL
jgi:hypothetical protein